MMIYKNSLKINVGKRLFVNYDDEKYEKEE